MSRTSTVATSITAGTGSTTAEAVDVHGVHLHARVGTGSTMRTMLAIPVRPEAGDAFIGAADRFPWAR
jgi:hypothetical protein